MDIRGMNHRRILQNGITKILEHRIKFPNSKIRPLKNSQL